MLGSDQGDNQFPAEIRSPVCAQVVAASVDGVDGWCGRVASAKARLDVGGMCFN